MLNLTAQPNSLVTIKSVSGQIWQARLVRFMETSEDIIVRRHDGLVHELAIERVIHIGEPDDCQWC